MSHRPSAPSSCSTGLQPPKNLYAHLNHSIDIMNQDFHRNLITSNQIHNHNLLVLDRKVRFPDHWYKSNGSNINGSSEPEYDAHGNPLLLEKYKNNILCSYQTKYAIMRDKDITWQNHTIEHLNICIEQIAKIERFFQRDWIDTKQVMLTNEGKNQVNTNYLTKKIHMGKCFGTIWEDRMNSAIRQFNGNWNKMSDDIQRVLTVCEKLHADGGLKRWVHAVLRDPEVLFNRNVVLEGNGVGNSNTVENVESEVHNVNSVSKNSSLKSSDSQSCGLSTQVGSSGSSEPSSVEASPNHSANNLNNLTNREKYHNFQKEVLHKSLLEVSKNQGTIFDVLDDANLDKEDESVRLDSHSPSVSVEEIGGAVENVNEPTTTTSTMTLQQSSLLEQLIEVDHILLQTLHNTESSSKLLSHIVESCKRLQSMVHIRGKETMSRLRNTEKKREEDLREEEKIYEAYLEETNESIGGMVKRHTPWMLFGAVGVAKVGYSLFQDRNKRLSLEATLSTKRSSLDAVQKEIDEINAWGHELYTSFEKLANYCVRYYRWWGFVLADLKPMISAWNDFKLAFENELLGGNSSDNDSDVCTLEDLLKKVSKAKSSIISKSSESGNSNSDGSSDTFATDETDRINQLNIMKKQLSKTENQWRSNIKLSKDVCYSMGYDYETQKKIVKTKQDENTAEVEEVCEVEGEVIPVFDNEENERLKVLETKIHNVHAKTHLYYETAALFYLNKAKLQKCDC